MPINSDPTVGAGTQAAPSRVDPTGSTSQPVTVGEGGITALGSTSGSAVTSDVAGTAQQYLRGLAKFIGSIWDSAACILRVEQGFNYTNISTNTTTVIKSGSGLLHTVVINTRGSSSGASMYDNSASSGSSLGILDTTLSTTAFVYDLEFVNGLTVRTAGIGAADITVTWR